MNEKNYTDEQISTIKKQWLRAWMGIYGFLFLIVAIVWIMFVYKMTQQSAEMLGDVVSKVMVIAIEGLLFGFLPLYYCAYKRPGTKLIGFWILLDSVLIAYDFYMFCIRLVTTLQNDDFREVLITTSLALYTVIFGTYFLQLLWKGYILLVFYRLYQVNSFLQKQKINNDDVIENIK